jgi:hypothetical protein
MSLKRVKGERVVTPDPQDLRDKVKAGLLEAQSLVENSRPTGRTRDDGCSSLPQKSG